MVLPWWLVLDFDSVDDERCSRSFMSFGTAPSLVAALSLWRFSGLAIAASFYLPSKCVRYFWLRLWHSTSSMKLHFVHFFLMLTLPWRNSRALIVTDANTRSFLLKGSCEHAHRLHSFIKNKSLSTNLNRKLPRLLDLCFYKLHYTDSKFFTKTNFVLDVLSSSSTWLLCSLHACPLQRVLLASEDSSVDCRRDSLLVTKSDFVCLLLWRIQCVCPNMAPMPKLAPLSLPLVPLSL